MKKYQKILSIIGLLILFVTGFFFITNKVRGNESAIDTNYLSISQEDTSVYYLNKQTPNIAFEIEADNLDYKLLDDEGNEVKATVKETMEDTYLIKAPSKGYDEGKSYTLELDDGNYFKNEELQDARKLVFKIRKEPIAHYKFSEEVIELDEPIIELDNNRIEVKNDKIKIGDIIFSTNQDDDYVAYKIVNLLDDNRAEVTMPAIEEVYDELEVYGEYQIDFEDHLSDSKKEAQLVKEIKDSSLFNDLIKSAYADDHHQDDIQVDYKHQIKSGRFKETIKIKLDSDEDGLFEKESLKNTTIQLILTNHYDLRMFIDINDVLDWNVSALQNAAFSWDLEIDSKNNKSLTSKEEDDIAHNINKILEGENDTFTGAKSLFQEFKYHVPNVPGLTIHVDPALNFNLNLLANLKMDNTYTLSNTTGIILNEGEFEPYSYFTFEEEGLEAYMKGDLDWESGLSIKTTAKLFESPLLDSSLAYFALQPELGLYIDSAILGEFTTENKDFLKGYLETGVYIKGGVEAMLTSLTGKQYYNQPLINERLKIDPFSFGNTVVPIALITDDSEVVANDFYFDPPVISLESIDLKNKKRKIEELPIKEIDYHLENNQQLKFEKDQLVLPKTKEDTIIITSSYVDQHDQKHYVDYPVTISDNQGYLIHQESFKPPMTFVLGEANNPYLISPYINLTLNPDQTFNGMFILGGQDRTAYEGVPYTGSEFSGKITEIEELDSYTYLIKMNQLDYNSNERFWEARPADIPQLPERRDVLAASEFFLFENQAEFYLHAPGQPMNRFPVISVDQFGDGISIINFDMADSIPNHYLKNNRLDTWVIQPIYSNIQDSVLLYQIY